MPSSSLRRTILSFLFLTRPRSDLPFHTKTPLQPRSRHLLFMFTYLLITLRGDQPGSPRLPSRYIRTRRRNHAADARDYCQGGGEKERARVRSDYRGGNRGSRTKRVFVGSKERWLARLDVQTEIQFIFLDCYTVSRGDYVQAGIDDNGRNRTALDLFLGLFCFPARFVIHCPTEQPRPAANRYLCFPLD